MDGVVRDRRSLDGGTHRFSRLLKISRHLSATYAWALVHDFIVVAVFALLTNAHYCLLPSTHRAATLISKRKLHQPVFVHVSARAFLIVACPFIAVSGFLSSTLPFVSHYAQISCVIWSPSLYETINTSTAFALTAFTTCLGAVANGHKFYAPDGLSA